jgi:hypothetical protein
MGVKFPQTVNGWLRENGFLPPPGEQAADSVESDKHENSDINVGCVDLDTKIQQLLARFEPGQAVPLARITGFFHQLLRPALACQIVIASFDPRVEGKIIVPRLEVAINRQKEAGPRAVERGPIDFDRIDAVDPHLADVADKLGFRTFLAASLAERAQSITLAIFAPDNTVHGTHWLCRLLEDVVDYTEGDTRIPAALCALRRAGRLHDRSRVALWTNDTDCLWMVGTVGTVAAMHLHRPNTKDGKPDVVIDLVKLRASVERRMGCDYLSWIFWTCLFRNSDYTSTPPGFCSIGNQANPPGSLVRFDQTAGRLEVNRRHLRSLLFRSANRAIPLDAVAKHLNRLVWSASFYLLLKPDPHAFGWTNRPFEYKHTDILRLDEAIAADDAGWITVI